MARKRTRKPKLPKLLDKSPDVVAAVDSDFEVIYANESCCNWLNIPPEDLVGRILNFGEQPGPTVDSRRSGICPDPTCFSEEFRVASGHISTYRDGKVAWKSATYTAIREANEQPNQVLIVGTGPDLSTLNSSTDVSVHLQLQQLVDKLRAQDYEQYAMTNLLGKSDFAIQLKRKIEAVAGNRSDCLIVGPPGSGKEHVARTIFAKRKHPSTNLVSVHCAIADSEVIQESIKEWALEQRERNSTDWLLLLDVDQMQVDAQCELFGYTQIPNFQMRILATSEENLLRHNDFHRGLAMELSIQVIELEPLHQRKADIPLLAQSFVESLNKSKAKNISHLGDEVLEQFYEYSWPRNLDEFEECVTQAHQNCSANVIVTQNLPDQFTQALSAEKIGYHQPEKIVMDKFLANIERQLISRALTQTKNNKTKAADLLGVSRAKLLRRAAALDLIEQPSLTEDATIESEMFREAD